METKISVLLADPGEQYRAAYSKAIGQETDMELVAQTDNGLRAEELITKFQPDVVVLDLVLPNLDGLSLLTHLRAKNASSRVIVTSAICNDQVLMECAELGTTYFMQKPFDPPLLVQRILHHVVYSLLENTLGHGRALPAPVLGDVGDPSVRDCL